MTQESIYIHFSRACTQAQALETAAGRIRSRARRGQRSLAAVARCWDGSNARSWQSKTNACLEALQTAASSLEESAGQIRRAAQTTYDAEMAALALARSRTFS